MASQPAAADSDLIARMRTGDEAALARAYDRFGTLAYSIAYHVLGDAADAEEVVAEVFLQVWTTAASFDATRASLAAWLSMITRSRALDRARARQRRGRLLDQASGEPALTAATAADDPSEAAGAAELRGHVLRCLAELPAEQRQPLELAYYGGLSHSEIAAQLDEPLGTVKTRIRSGMRKLRETLGAYHRYE